MRAASKWLIITTLGAVAWGRDAQAQAPESKTALRVVPKIELKIVEEGDRLEGFVEPVPTPAMVS
jgi:hypothetical protein